MRLEPVYLVAPKPKPPMMTRRRALLLAGSMLATGLGVGCAGGYWLGTPSHDAQQPPPPEDTTLRELRRLATDAPVAELLTNWSTFLGMLNDTYPHDAVLWRGAERLGEAIVADENLVDRRRMAAWLVQVITTAESDAARALDRLVPPLQRIR
jgi:hypothetical protein